MKELLPLLEPDPHFQEIAQRATDIGQWVAANIYEHMPGVATADDLTKMMVRDVRTTFLNRTTYNCVGLTLARGAITDFLGRPDRHRHVWTRVGMKPPTPYYTKQVGETIRAFIAWGWLFNWIPDYELSLRTLARSQGIESMKPKPSGKGANHVALFKVAQKLVEVTDLTTTKASTGRKHSTEFLDHLDLVSKVRGTVHNYGLHTPFDDVTQPPDEVTWNGRTRVFPRGKPLKMTLKDGAEILHGAVENWGRLVKGEPFRSHLEEIADYRCEEDNPLLAEDGPSDGPR